MFYVNTKGLKSAIDSLEKLLMSYRSIIDLQETSLKRLKLQSESEIDITEIDRGLKKLMEVQERIRQYILILNRAVVLYNKTEETTAFNADPVDLELKKYDHGTMIIDRDFIHRMGLNL